MSGIRKEFWIDRDEACSICDDDCDRVVSFDDNEGYSYEMICEKCLREMLEMIKDENTKTQAD